MSGISGIYHLRRLCEAGCHVEGTRVELHREQPGDWTATPGLIFGISDLSMRLCGVSCRPRTFPRFEVPNISMHLRHSIVRLSKVSTCSDYTHSSTSWRTSSRRRLTSNGKMNNHDFSKQTRSEVS